VPSSECQSTVIVYTHTHTTTTVLWPFVREYPGEQVPEETHPPTILIIIT